MAAQSSLPSPPATPCSPIPTLSNPSSDNSLTHLDSLLATYLDLLDNYTALRSELSKQFSGGFFALANANRTSNLGSGRRYGEEGYDERMKSGRRVSIQVKATEREGDNVECDVARSNGDAEPGMSSTAYVFAVQNMKAEDDDACEGRAEKIKVEDQGLPLPQSSMEIDTTSTSMPTAKSKSKPTAGPKLESKTKPKPKNPLNWYGILVPPSLRHAQSSFTTAITTSVPQLLTVSAEMLALEARITELREQLDLPTQPQGSARGPLDLTNDNDNKVRESLQQQQDKDILRGTELTSSNTGTGYNGSKDPASSMASSKRKTSAKKPTTNLVERPAEPRSRVLKLD